MKQTCLDSHGLMSIGRWKAERNTAKEQNVNLHVLETSSGRFRQLEEPDMTRGLNCKGRGNTENITQLTGQKHLNMFYFLFLNVTINTLSPELNLICYLLALLAHDFLHVSRIRVKPLTLRLLMSYIYIYIYIYIAPIPNVSRSHTTTHHSR
jgi:hypothetical protein